MHNAVRFACRRNQPPVNRCDELTEVTGCNHRADLHPQIFRIPDPFNTKLNKVFDHKEVKGCDHLNELPQAGVVVKHIHDKVFVTPDIT